MVPARPEAVKILMVGQLLLDFWDSDGGG